MFNVTAIFSWLDSAFSAYGYLIIPLGALLESMAFISLAAPGLIILLLAGYYASQGVVWLPFVILLGLLGALMGDNISYFIGKCVWNRYARNHYFGKKIEKLSGSLVNRTIWFFPFFHFSGYGRALVPLASGALRIPFARWIKYDIIGAALWSICFTLLGYFVGFFGSSIESVFKKSDIIEWVFSAVFVAWIIIAILTFRRLIRDIAGSEDDSGNT